MFSRSRATLVALSSLAKVKSLGLSSVPIVSTSLIGHLCRRIDHILHASASTFGSDSSSKPMPHGPLEKLRFLDRVYVNQLPFIKTSPGIFGKAGISTLEFDVLDKNSDQLFYIQFRRGSVSEDYTVKMFSNRKERVPIAYTYLEPDLYLKNLAYPIQTLRMNSPQEHHIVNMYEMRGINKVAIMETASNEPLCMLLTEGDYSWTTSANILTSTGDKKIGKIYKMKTEARDNSLGVMIHFPNTFLPKYKASLIGASLILMGKPK